MRSWWMALVLGVFVAGDAVAGGVHARIEDPAADRTTYTARMIACDKDATFEPWALAEGVVDGKPQSRLLRLEPTSEHGVYRFARTWPDQGEWMIRLSLGYPHAPATVASLKSDGSVRNNNLYFNSDGSQECWKALRKHLARLEDHRC